MSQDDGMDARWPGCMMPDGGNGPCAEYRALAARAEAVERKVAEVEKRNRLLREHIGALLGVIANDAAAARKAAQMEHSNGVLRAAIEALRGRMDDRVTVWDRFACAAIMRGESTDNARRTADRMMAARRERLKEGEEGS